MGVKTWAVLIVEGIVVADGDLAVSYGWLYPDTVKLTILQNSVRHLALDLRLRIPASQQLQQMLVLCHPVHRPDDKDRFGRVRLLWEIISGEVEG